jgi:hypothetical protein
LSRMGARFAAMQTADVRASRSQSDGEEWQMAMCPSG